GARAVAALVAHPDAVHSALAVAANALSKREFAGEFDGEVEVVRGTEPRRVSPAEADRRIAARSRTGRKEALLTSDEMAGRLGLKSRQSVHDWLKKGRLVGWQSAKRGYVFPAGQLDARGQPLEGLDRVLALFEDGYTAWIWLTTPRPGLEGATPLALLRRGEVERAAAAAAGDAQGDFA
ncbi:MAG TPA: hypothetical protein VLL72_07600, partial [Kiloniellales bacterium]|nr:hypothetical protein [Kiloniellales bacterium]